MDQNYDGVKFYSAADLSCGYSLEKAETVLQAFCFEEEFTDINRVIELFNIKQFFDHDLRLKKWTDTGFEHYKSITKEFDHISAVFFSMLNNDNFLQRIEEVDVNYIGDFWFLISKFKVYERISEDAFMKAIDQKDFNLQPLLKHKDIVYYYGQAIANHLSKSSDSAELLMAQFLEKSKESKDTLWFPKELSGELKEKLILDYIRSEEANPNYLSLIAGSQSTPDLPLHDKTRLEARKKYEAYMESHFSKDSGFSYGAEIIFSKTQDEEILFTATDSHELSISYSSKWIEENQDYPTLLNNFIYLFQYVDRFFRSQFVSQPAQLGVFERFLGVKGKKDYETGMHFNINHMSFDLQMVGYYRELSRLNIKIESLFKWFFESYLCDEFQAKGFTYVTPSDGTTDLEKCKLLASEIDSVLKQFNMFITEGCIDRELFEMSSGHVKFENVPSFCQEKYIYPKNEVCKGSMNLLFSEQSGLAYTEKTRSRYKDFFSLLKNETMYFEDFAEYDRPKIEWLSQHGCITIDDSGILALNMEKACILKDLYNNQVCCLKYLERYQSILSSMVDTDEIQYEASLFSKPEQAYINFILNKAEFSNGRDLRNKYIHGTHSLREEDHQKDYIELLKIMVLIVIKINEEFCLLSSKQIYVDYY